MKKLAGYFSSQSFGAMAVSAHIAVLKKPIIFQAKPLGLDYTNAAHAKGNLL
jgi:hypothetical protein